ncbi:Bgt-5262 [Blumeria graminis f. sp. tritici]|uniref:Bgt-5262 n=2 Tax=Blumeria graminis f. sp. tritici TaxID=62690 RepID=A0A9X9MM12_BLUGR|nr:hypothetical protein BGT96224_5262 [Blumeria graminis f. sp. tritici 96224]VDB91182.1 Bgt-5262 [Blumeria graminis f. sp. tritici]
MPQKYFSPENSSDISEKNYPLSDQINIANRARHTHLNKLIIERLPLALPPFSQNPSVYATGLLHFAPIYIAFEELWDNILHPSQCSSSLRSSFPPISFETGLPNPYTGSNPSSPISDSPSLPDIPRICSRKSSLLCKVRLPELLRTGRLRSDLKRLIGVTEDEVQEQIMFVSTTGALAKFLEHMRQSVTENPHLLLAYAWVFYMALFSGGRYLRASLKEAGGSGANFWAQSPSPFSSYSNMWTNSKREKSQTLSGSDSKSISILTPAPPANEDEEMLFKLSFFHFVGNDDGEDIKREFKHRFNESETLLSDNEKSEIVLESQLIFKFMIEIIGYLDEEMSTQEDDLDNSSLPRQSRLLMTARDSVSVAKERMLQRSYSEPSGLGVSVSKAVSFELPFPTLKSARAASASRALHEKQKSRALGSNSTGFKVIETYNLMSILPLIGLFPLKEQGIDILSSNSNQMSRVRLIMAARF